MATSPRWKCYTQDGEYRASCKYPEEAAAVVSLLGEGATIRDGHKLAVWVEGSDGYAADSYDVVAETAYRRGRK